MNKVFLGGTCNGSTWRDDLIRVLDVDYFNPVVDDWTPECQEIEELEMSRYCNIHLYVITSDMVGVFRIAESIESVMTKGKQTIFHVIPEGFGKVQLKSLKEVANMVSKNGGIGYIDEELDRAAVLLNHGYGS